MAGLRLSFRAKLGVIVGVAATALVLLIIVGAITGGRVVRQLNEIQQRQLPKLELGPRIELQFDRLRRAYQDAVAAGDFEGLAATRQIRNALLEQLATAQGVVDPQPAAALREAIEHYHVTAVEVSRRLLVGDTGEEMVAAMADMQNKQSQVAELLKRVAFIDRRALANSFAMATAAQENAVRVPLVVAVACLVLVVLLCWQISRSVLRSVTELAVGLKRFGSGDFTAPIPIVNRDDMGEVAGQANQMAESLKALAAERDRADWLKGAQVGLAQELRGELDPDDVADRAVRFLARYLDAQAGALYYADRDRVLRLRGRYALSAAAALTNGPAAGPGAAGRGAMVPAFELGEGLVGQAALDDRLVVIADPPADYVRIRSGLGETAPRAIVLLPLPHLGTVRGVLELALLVPWSATRGEALMAIRETLVIAIEVARARAATRDLLAETQRLAQRLSSQEELLRSRNEELQAQREELQHSNSELAQQTEERETQRRILEEKNRELDEAGRRLSQKAAELTTVSAYKSQFLTNMSHELRTPLNSMLLLSNLLADNAAANLTDKQVEYARTIYLAGKDLLALINQVLDLAKVESGRQEIVLGPVAIRDLATRIERVFRPLASDKGLELTVAVDAGLPDGIVTDRHRLEQVLNNLLGNAIKFTSRGGVSLRIGRPDPDQRPRRSDLRVDRAVAFVVRDSGPGIAAQDQERIFIPFEQLEGAPDRRFGGTGLGLGIARQLVSLLGGELTLRSAPGQGSTFVCTLPVELPSAGELPAVEPHAVAAAPDAAAAFPSVVGVTSSAPDSSRHRDDWSGASADALLKLLLDPGDVRFNSRTILVVDDDMRTAYALSALLSARGAEVIVADTGREALAQLEAHPEVEAVLMDVMMPEMDGYEAMRRIRGELHLAALPIIALTARATAGEPERCRKAGASDFLPKPIDAQRLMTVLHERLVGVSAPTAYDREPEAIP